LATWDDVYEIKNLVEGNFRNLEHIILDKIHPADYDDCVQQIMRKSRAPLDATLLREEWAFWNHKLFDKLSQIDLTAFWEKCQFGLQQGQDGGNFILER